MATRMPTADDIRKIEDPDRRGAAIRAYFDMERDMRTVRDEYIRERRAAGVTIAATAKASGVSDATVKNIAGPRTRKEQTP